MRKILLFVLFLFAALSGPVFGQDTSADDVIKVNTVLVSVPVVVSDREGHYVQNLQQKDFVLLGDDKPMKIDFFAAAEEPVNLALLIDTSHSTSDALGDIKNAAKDLVKQLQPRDKAVIVSFDFAPHVLCPLTSDQEILKGAIKKADIGDKYGTTLNDAVAEVAGKLFAGINGRKAIILLTDGKDDASRTTRSELYGAVAESDTVVYSVVFQASAARDVLRIGSSGRARRAIVKSTSRRREDEDALDFLGKLSGRTGGRFYSSEASKLNKTFASILEELRFQYRLGFYLPEDDKTIHALKVGVARPDVLVRTRSQYRLQKTEN
jgi:Ca-activated chloride channel homolog